MLIETAGNMNTGQQAPAGFTSGIDTEYLYTPSFHETDFRTGSIEMAGESLPPQRLALYSAGGGFGGALLAIIVAKILSGPCCCCCAEAPDGERQKAATVSAVTESRSAEGPAATG